MRIDAQELTRLLPKTTIVARQLKSLLTGKPYFFNGQRLRRRVFELINEKVPFENYIETGTNFGRTTHFLARIARRRGATVHSSEINLEYYRIAVRTVGDLKNVRLHHGSSVEFLRSLSTKLAGETNFVYLDAHWYDYLPLRDEIAIISEWPRTIIMIDDFKVPHDEQFNWDKYDAGRELHLQYIEDLVRNIRIFFPNYPARAEGKVAHGYCVIATAPDLQRVLESVPLLK